MKKQSDNLNAQSLQNNRIKTFKLVFGTPDGKSVLMDMCRNAQIFDSIRINGSKHVDPHLLSYREGQRSVVMFIIEILGLDETDFINQVMNGYD